MPVGGATVAQLVQAAQDHPLKIKTKNHQGLQCQKKILLCPSLYRNIIVIECCFFSSLSCRSSSSGSKRNEKDRDKAPGRSFTSGPKRSFHSTTTPDSHKEQQAAALQMVKQMTSSKQPPSSTTTQAATPTSVPAVQVQVKAVEKKPPSPPLVDTLDEETLQRKAHTIIDELVANKDFRVGVICV